MSEVFKKPISELPCFASIPLSEVTVRGNTFTFNEGLEREHVAQLQAYSLDLNDQSLQQATSDHERFGTGSYEAWYAKQRIPFTFIEKERNLLAGLIWFGPKPLGRKSLKHLDAQSRHEELLQKETMWHTVSYRAYNPFRGTGIMKPLCTRAIDAYKTLFPSSKLWLSIDTENEASFGLAESLGFVRDVAASVPAEHHYVYTYTKNI
ncbi:MAG: Acetyltransferase domain [Candidatus Parcubacteria bacterium]|jgi:RimJ/RimL family protein N-acetyltransferase